MSESVKEENVSIQNTEQEEQKTSGSSNTVETFIVRSKEEVSRMFDQTKIMKGVKSTQQVQDEFSQKQVEEKDDVNGNKISIPDELFKDYPEINKANEKQFEYVVYQIITGFLENFSDKALEFPACIDSSGRSIIHDMGNYLGLAHHSQGTNKKRRILVYPKSLFKNKQEQEKKRLEKEKEKIKRDFKDYSFIGASDDPKSFREQVIREVYNEQKGISNEENIAFTNMLNDGPIPERVEELKKRMKAYEDEIAKQAKEFQAKQLLEESQKSGQDLTTNETGDSKLSPAQDANNRRKSSGDYKNAEVEIELTEEEKQELAEREQRIQEQLQQEYQKKMEFDKNLKQITLQTFKDKPEEVKTIRCVHSESNLIALEWDIPGDNNCPITQYHVYLSKTRFANVSTAKFQFEKDGEEQQEVKTHEFEEVMQTQEAYCELSDLVIDTVYYVKVRAENELGLGYDSEPVMVMTTSYNIDEACNLYVWGENSNAQLGLSDEQIKKEESSYHKFKMMKIVKNEQFNSTITQVSTGNVSTIMLYHEENSSKQMILQTGLTVLPKEEESEQTQFTKDEMSKLDNIPSLPFEIQFNIPVAKVSCGDLFASLLTVQGDVYTWGINIHGQLGLKVENLIATLNPMKVTFLNKNDKIIDISSGFNHTLALTDKKQLYVWGRRMGIYPSFDLNYQSIKQTSHLQTVETQQDFPRLMKSNLIYYKLQKIIAGPSTSALITESGELLLQGLNDGGQLGIGEELGKQLYFFPDFMKQDRISDDKNLKVIDVALGAFHTIVLCRDTQSNKNRVFGFGTCDNGQIGYGESLTQFSPIEVTDKIPGEVLQIAAGALHSMFLTKDNKLYGCGKVSRGQLGFKPQHKVKSQLTPIEIPIPTGVSIKSIHCGSLQSMVLGYETQDRE